MNMKHARKEVPFSCPIWEDGVPIGVKLKSLFFDIETEIDNFLLARLLKIQKISLIYRAGEIFKFWGPKRVLRPPSWHSFSLFCLLNPIFRVDFPLYNFGTSGTMERKNHGVTRWLSYALTMLGQEVILWGRSGIYKVSFLSKLECDLFNFFSFDIFD